MNYIMDIEPESWVYYSNADVALYSWHTTNFAESQNQATDEEYRLLNPYTNCDGMMGRTMDDNYQRSVLARKWLDEGLFVTPKATLMFET